MLIGRQRPVLEATGLTCTDLFVDDGTRGRPREILYSMRRAEPLITTLSLTRIFD